MSATFDTTTKTAYDAATTATARAAAIVASLSSGGSPQGSVLVKVYNGASPDVEMGSGTMAAPWATASGGTVVIGEVSSFTVGTTGTPNANWYIKFRTLDGTRWVRASFGLTGSGQDFTWSLSTFTAGQTGTIGTATIVCGGNAAPVFTVAPTATNIAATGGTIQFTATDPDGGTILYSLATTRSGITINSSTGLVTVTSAAAGTSGDIVVQASDGILATTTTCAVRVIAPASIKWYPGHYGLTQANDSQATKFALFDELGTGWQGAQVRYFWGNIESALGVYDWSTVRADRDRLQANGKRLWVQILTTKFGTFSSIGNTIPTYMQTAAYNGGAVITSDRVIAQLWTASVMDRYVALMQAFAAEFDDDEFVVGICGEETATGASAPLVPYGYSGTSMSTQLKRGLTAMRPSFARTPLLVYANFFNSWSSTQIQDFFEHLEAEKVAVGGPDNNPDEGTTGKSYYTGEVGTQDYRGTLPAGFANQRESTRDYPFADLYAYAVNTLRMNWMFTLKNTIDSNTSWADIKTFVDANPDLVSALPTVYQ